MAFPTKPCSLPEESEAFLQNQSTVELKSIKDKLHTHLPGCEAEVKVILLGQVSAFDTKKEAETSSKGDNYVNRKKNTYINKHLIPLRIAVFLWFGAGRIPVTFLSVFMKQRGMSLIQFSSVFSITFLFQFLCASISGIVADKIGSAKPVLMFHMLATLTVIICMLLAPSISLESCNQQEVDVTCPPVIEIAKYLPNCNFACLKNGSLVQGINQNVDRLSYSNDTVSLLFFKAFFNGNESYENESSIYDFDSLCEELNNTCGKLCSSRFENDCFIGKEFVIIYTTLILCFFTFWSTVYRVMDIIIVSLATKHKSDLGKERFIGAVGEFLVSCFAALVMNVSTAAEVVKNYDSVYWVSATCVFLSFVAICTIKSHTNPPGKRLWKKALKLIRHADVKAFVAVVFVMGNSFCFGINFNLYFLEFLEAPKVVFGLYTASFSFYGILVLLTSKWWLNTLGTTKIFVIGLLCYTASSFGYSFLYNSWLSLIIESTSAFSYHLLWVAVITHCHRLAPEGLVATVNSVAGAVHFGIGRSTGVLGGGLLINAFGQRVTYRIVGTMCLVTAILYSIFLYKRHEAGKKY